MEKTRLYFVDNLRVLLITLVIMLHLSVTYGGSGGWYYSDGEPDQISGIVLTIQNAINQSFVNCRWREGSCDSREPGGRNSLALAGSGR